MDDRSKPPTAGIARRQTEIKRLLFSQEVRIPRKPNAARRELKKKFSLFQMATTAKIEVYPIQTESTSTHFVAMIETTMNIPNTIYQMANLRHGERSKAGNKETLRCNQEVQGGENLEKSEARSQGKFLVVADAVTCVEG